MATTQPGRAGKDIFAGLVPVDGVDDRLEAMLDVPDGSSQRVTRVVRGDCESVERRREGRRERLVGLRILERLDERKVFGNLFRGRWLEEERVVGGGALGVGKGDFGKGGGGDRGRGEGCRGVEILRQGAPEVDDWPCRIDGNPCKEWEMLAAMGVRCDVGDGGVGQEDEGERRDLSTAKMVSKEDGDTVEMDGAYFSSSLSFSTSKASSHPTSIRTLTPPSSSSSDCDAVESDRAPWSGQKLNMAVTFCLLTTWRRR